MALQYLPVFVLFKKTPGHFFTTNERWKDREELLGWVRRQAARAGFTISIDKSSTITSYMNM